MGCGPGYWSGLFSDMDYIGFDQNEEMIKLAKEVNPKLNFVQSGSLSIFPDKEFDLIFTASVLQHNKHVPAKTNLLKHINRLLKSDGYFFCTETTFTPENTPGYHDNYSDGYSFTMKGWKTFIEAFGFSLISFHSPGEYLYKKI